MALPAFLKPETAALRITITAPDMRSELDLRVPTPAPLTEIWTLSIDFAPFALANAPAAEAWAEALDGRVTAFQISLAPPVFGNAAPAGLALAGAVARGAGSILLSVPNGPLYAGTLLSLGDPDSGGYQVFEVAADVDASETAQAVPVSPRSRFAFADDVDFAAGTVVGKFNLASDRFAVDRSHRGFATARMAAVEAVS